MVTRRGRGFTLIELLVVIAIIGILAAMLFPVFARARESARKTQCLSNVKNIAMGIQMYLTDYDAFPPDEHRQDAFEYFSGVPGAGGDPSSVCRVDDPENRTRWIATLANPYIHWPVVLDEYIKNRDVWRCPSARWATGAVFILPSYGGDWLRYLANSSGRWGNDLGFGPCDHMTFPPGWGGGVTDSIAQQTGAGVRVSSGKSTAGTTANGAFMQGIATMEENFQNMKLATVSDAASTPVCADGGVNPTWMTFGTMAYPDICCAECSGVVYYAWGGWPPLSDCGITGSDCGGCYSLHATIEWATSPERKKASARHMGGNNVGFADGHAKWFAAAAITAMSDSRGMQKLGWNCGGSTSYYGYLANCGSPDKKMLFLAQDQLGWSGW